MVREYLYQGPSAGAQSLAFSFRKSSLQAFCIHQQPSPSLRPAIALHLTITMASSRVFASRLASSMASTTTKATRPALRFQLNAAPKRTFTHDVSSGFRSQRKATPFTTATPFQTTKRSNILQSNVRQLLNNQQARRHYSSEIADAMVTVSQNMGMGSAAIGLGGAGVGIGLVFASLLTAVARNPALRGQLFSYAILGFAFVEAIGLFDLMIAMMCKYV